METDQIKNSQDNSESKKGRNKRGNDDNSGNNPKKQAMKGNTTKTIMIEVE